MEDRDTGGSIEIPSGISVPSLLPLPPERFEVERQTRKLREALPPSDRFEWRVYHDGMEYVGKAWFGHIPTAHIQHTCERCEKAQSEFTRLVVIDAIHAGNDPTRQITPSSDGKLHQALEERLFGVLCHEKDFCSDPSCLRFPRYHPS